MNENELLFELNDDIKYKVMYFQDASSKVFRMLEPELKDGFFLIEGQEYKPTEPAYYWLDVPTFIIVKGYMLSISIDMRLDMLEENQEKLTKWERLWSKPRVFKEAVRSAYWSKLFRNFSWQKRILTIAVIFTMSIIIAVMITAIVCNGLWNTGGI